LAKRVSRLTDISFKSAVLTKNDTKGRLALLISKGNGAFELELIVIRRILSVKIDSQIRDCTRFNDQDT